MANLLVTILAEIFNAKLIVRCAKRWAEPASRRWSLTVCFRDHLTVLKVVTSDIRPIFQIVKELVPRLRDAFRMFSIDAIQPIGYE